MYPSPVFDEPPAAVRSLRRAARGAVLLLLWVSPPGLGVLAALGEMGWELVSVLGLAVALAATLGGHPMVAARHGRLVLAVGLGVATGLWLGAGHATMPVSVSLALPFVMLALAGAMCDGRALLAALALLMLACLLPLGARPSQALPLVQAGGLAALALMLVVAQRLWRRAARRGEQVAVLSPAPRRAGGPAKAFSQPAPESIPPAFLVQAERAPDGTVRVALAGRQAQRLRVTVS